jgi:hypothetical protein
LVGPKELRSCSKLSYEKVLVTIKVRTAVRCFSVRANHWDQRRGE